MAQATHLARTTSADRALTHAAGTNYTLVQSTQTYVNDVAAMLAEAVWYIDAAAAGYAGGQTVTNLGTGGTALDATLGSTGGSDTNDPLWLDYTGSAYVRVPGIVGNYLSSPDAASLRLTGDIDLIARLALDDWTPSSVTNLIAKFSTTGQFAYRLYIDTSGRPVFGYSNDGTTLIARTASTATGVTDGAPKWVRATMDIDNGSSQHEVKFYLSDDGSSWTQLGTTVTTAGVATIFAGTSTIGIGDRSNTAGQTSAGKFYRAIIKDGIGGSTVLDVDTSVITSGDATSFTATTGQTVTINRAASGRKTVAVVGKTFLLGTDDYIDSAATGTSQIVVNRTWSGSTPTFTLGYSTSPDGQIGSGGAAPTDGEVIASAMWDRTLTAGERAALLTYFQTRG
jgi:hypothetical protein